MDQLAAWNYDGLMIMAKAIADANVDWGAIKDDPAAIAAAREQVRDNILATQGYHGVMGTFSFTPNGNGLHEVSVIEIHQDGNPTLMKVVNVMAGEEASIPVEPVAADPAKEPIPMAMLVPITGASATEGSYFIKAADLAIEQINNEQGGVNGQAINFEQIDNQSSNPGALNALNKAVNQDNVFSILGPVKSTQIFAISDAVKEYAVPMLIGGTNFNLTEQGNSWLFRCRPDDSIAAQAMVQYSAEDLGLTKIGILHDTDAFGTGGADLVQQFAEERGLDVVARESYTTKDREFTAQLLSLKNAGAEIMILYGTNPEDVSVIQRQYRQLDPGYLYLGSPSSAMKDALSLSKEAAEGLLAIADYVPGQTTEARQYAEDYLAKYDEPMDQLAAWNYDGLMIMIQAMRDAEVDWSLIKTIRRSSLQRERKCAITFSPPRVTKA